MFTMVLLFYIWQCIREALNREFATETRKMRDLEIFSSPKGNHCKAGMLIPDLVAYHKAFMLLL